MQKTLTRLFTAVMMAALLVSASIMSVSAATTDCNGHADAEGWTPVDTVADFTDEADGKYYLTDNVTGGITVTAKDVVLCLNGKNLTNTDNTAITVSSGASLTLCNCGATTSTVSGGLTVASGTGSGEARYTIVNRGTLNMEANVVVETACRGVLQAGGTFNMNGGTIQPKADAATEHRGVYQTGGTFNMYDGALITGFETTGNSGPGVMQEAGGKFYMYGGTISNNSTNSPGGGVLVRGTFNMSGGTITGNTGSNGGGVCGDKATSNFTMTGGTISDNEATSNGGGVFVTLGSIKMSGDSSICRNTAGADGGGVVVDGASASFTMSGGTIDGNTATTSANGGGGVTVKNSATGDFTGGTVSNNTVENKTYGGGVSVSGTGSLNISGEFQSYGNKVQDDKAGGVAKLNGTGTGTISGGKFGDPIILTKGNTTITGGEFSTDPSNYLADGKTVETDENAEIYKYKVVDLKPNDCSVTPGNHNGEWKQITETMTINASGHYVLQNDLNPGNILVNGAGIEVTICLNGHSITPTATTGLHVQSGKVTLCNCSSTVSTIKTGTSRAVAVGNNTGDTVGEKDILDYLTIDSDKITISGSGSEGGVVIFREGKLILNKGTITDSSTQSTVRVRGGEFEMNGGIITGNTVPGVKLEAASAGEIDSVFGSFVMNDGTISDNTAGGVLMDANTNFTMIDGTISDNTTTSRGGGVWLKGKDAQFHMQGGTISGNTAASIGGGVMVGTDGVAATMIMESGAVIDNNTSNVSSNGGGGISTYSTSTLTINGGTISNNKCPNASGGGVNVGASTTFVMKDGTFFGNTAATGDGLYLTGSGGSATISGGTFYANVSEDDSTNVAIYAGSRAVTISAETADLCVKGKVGLTATPNCTISGGKFSADTAWTALNSRLPADTTLTVAEIEEGDYAYVVTEKGFANTGAVMNHGSSLDFSLALDTKADTSAENFTLTVTGDYTSGGVTTDEDTLGLIATAKGIAAKEMHDDITFTITDSKGDTWFKKTVSLYDAAKMMHNDAKTDAEKQVYADMIQYGNAAQTEFNYNTGNMATLGTASEAVTGAWGATDGAGVSDTAYANDVAATLSLKEKIQLNIYINDPQAIVTGATKVENNVNGKLTKVTFDNINVVDVRDTSVEIIVTPSDGGEAFTVKYGINDYVLAAQGGDQADLIKALQMYVDSVISYIGE